MLYTVLYFLLLSFANIPVHQKNGQALIYGSGYETTCMFRRVDDRCSHHCQRFTCTEILYGSNDECIVWQNIFTPLLLRKVNISTWLRQNCRCPLPIVQIFRSISLFQPRLPLVLPLWVCNCPRTPRIPACQ